MPSTRASWAGLAGARRGRVVLGIGAGGAGTNLEDGGRTKNVSRVSVGASRGCSSNIGCISISELTHGEVKFELCEQLLCRWRNPTRFVAAKSHLLTRYGRHRGPAGKQIRVLPLPSCLQHCCSVGVVAMVAEDPVAMASMPIRECGLKLLSKISQIITSLLNVASEPSTLASWRPSARAAMLNHSEEYMLTALEPLLLSERKYLKANLNFGSRLLT
ncbi:hypothetical protein EJB05_07224, partial [Eragrostis curvula]